MIESVTTTQTNDTTQYNKPRRVLTYVKNERMGGYVPKWETVKTPEPQTPKQQVEQQLAAAETGELFGPPESALAYQPSDDIQGAYSGQQEEFTFGDLVDMANPLHHIPVVGHMYREMTGDEIKPIGNIVGGALFGGPFGAASGLMNAISIAETGKGLTENTMDMLFTGEMPRFNHSQDSEPEYSIAIDETAQELPGTVIAFADLGRSSELPQSKAPVASYPEAQREPITELFLSSVGIMEDY